jgi:hypothetical protein
VSALQIGALLFVIGGVFDALIGALTPIVTRISPQPPQNTFMLDSRSDLALFGRLPQALVAESPALAMLYRLTFDLIGTLLLVFGLLQAAVAWFALRQGQAWALFLLVGIDLLFVAGWALVFSTYVRAGVPVSGTSLPPNLLVPALLLIPATAFAIIGLRQPVAQ